MSESDLNHVLMLNNNVIGVFNSTLQLNNYVDGCVQNNFFTKEMICVKTFVVNSCFNVDLPVNNSQVNNKILLLKNAKTNVSNPVKNITLPVKDDSKNSEEYLKIQQDKAELTHKINMLKNNKKKIENEMSIFNTEVELYKKFKHNLETDKTFSVPELFDIKYKLYLSLDNENKLNFEDYYKKWLEIRPSNNYNMFDTNSYEMSYHNKNILEHESNNKINLEEFVDKKTFLEIIKECDEEKDFSLEVEIS